MPASPEKGVDIKQKHLRIDRLYSRISTDIACQAGQPGGELTAVRIRNLSVGGLKFSCGHDAFNGMIPEDQRTPGRVVGVMVEINFELQPNGQPASRFNTQATIIHSERLSQDEFHIGVQFIDMEEAAFQVLKAYIDDFTPAKQ